ncbi:hypothetical protein ACWDXV_10235 [Nocardia nova]|uniref:hypothetical protein n=1 Tax=Nocardia TaxID=1817 RepID=UPI000A6D7F98|nr:MULTISPECIES: hypothetical protein [Nocardia]MBV7706249.1 hypothetical protein [Nocardia nova]
MMSALKKVCAATAIAGGLVMAAGPAGAAFEPARGGSPIAATGSGDTGSSLPSTGSGGVDQVIQFACAFATGITGSAAGSAGSSVPDIPGCS